MAVYRNSKNKKASYYFTFIEKYPKEKEDHLSDNKVEKVSPAQGLYLEVIFELQQPQGSH